MRHRHHFFYFILSYPYKHIISYKPMARILLPRWHWRDYLLLKPHGTDKKIGKSIAQHDREQLIYCTWRWTSSYWQIHHNRSRFFRKKQYIPSHLRSRHIPQLTSSRNLDLVRWSPRVLGLGEKKLLPRTSLSSWTSILPSPFWSKIWKALFSFSSLFIIKFSSIVLAINSMDH